MFTVCAARAIGNSRELCLDSRIHCVQCNDVHVCVCTNPVSKCTCKHMHACFLLLFCPLLTMRFFAALPLPPQTHRCYFNNKMLL